MSMMKVYAGKQAPPQIIALFRQHNIQLDCFDEQAEGRNPTTEELIKTLQDYDAFITVSFAKLDAAFFEQCKHLRIVQCYSVGYNHVDLDAANAHNIPIGNTPEVLSKATADTAFLLMQMCAKKAIINYKRFISGAWQSDVVGPLDFCGVDLQHKVVGIWGMGRIGFAFAKACVGAFGMKVIYHNRHRNLEYEAALNATYVSLEELFQQSDVLSLHANLTPENTGVVNMEKLSLMKPTAILVNTARGAHIVEDDLVKALEEKKIYAAGIDVYTVEPTGPDHVFCQSPDIITLPHIGSQTVETRMAMWEVCANNIINFFSNKPMISCVNQPHLQEVKKD